MDATTSTNKSLAEKNMQAYFKTHDVQYVAEDAVFRHMGSGDEYKGREAIAGMLHYVYHVAFDAHAEPSNYIITENKAMLEGMFVGKHIGDFAGIAATGKEVRVPLCVSYDIENGLIKEARIYMMGDSMVRQLTATS